MFVITDMEWVTNKSGHYSPTQLAAVRVDENWNKVDSFESLIRPRDESFYEWRHIAYVGAGPEDFLSAAEAYEVFTDFREWLNDDDIILWWYDEAERLFRALVSIILKTEETHRAVILGQYIYAFLSGQHHSKGNAYKLAEGRGIEVRKHLNHCSQNDARVIHELMMKIEYPQEKLFRPVKHPIAQPVDDGMYQYDPQTNTIHIKGCSHIANTLTHGYGSLKTAVRKGYKPCSCCRSEYRSIMREKNEDTLERVEYTYIYSPNSNVFHKCTCKLVLSAVRILGCQKYDTAVENGRRPCKRCNPTQENEIIRPTPIKTAAVAKKKKTEPGVGKKEIKAIKRQKTAAEERRRKLQDKSLSEAEKNDIYTLTQPRFAFWVGQGYQTFHLHSCSKLQGISNLRGFSTYKDAVRAGYTPCRKCRPTAKHDATLSIPITNRVRKGESIEKIEDMCRKAGYIYARENSLLCVETPVGKWRINVNVLPIKLEHINLVKTPYVKTYHEQPRIFLSLADTFDYIKRHDDDLAKKKESGKVFVKFVSEG